MAATEQSVRAALPDILAPALGDVTITECHRLTAGASAETWALAVDVGGRARGLILRLESGAEPFGFTPGKSAEARVQQAARDAGAPCAEVLAVLGDHPVLGHGYVMEALPGESLPQKLLRDEKYEQARQRLPEQCGAALANIHRVPLSALGDLPRQGAAEQLEQLYARHREYGEALPVLTLACQWLRQHIPECPEPALVHGDFRMGNFLLDEQGLVGVLDWEMTHIGDPLEDLGWLCVNAWRFGRRHRPVAGAGDRETLYRAYEEAGGRPVSRVAARYWELFGTFKWGVICQYQAYSYLHGLIPSMERAAIGRRVAETEYDMLVCLEELLEMNHAP